LQLRPEHAARMPFAPALPGVLAGGQYPNRWQPAPTGVGPDATDAGPHFSGIAPGATDEGERQGSTYVGQRFSGAGAGAGPIDIKPMIPLGQFRDTFIIAVDDEGVAIIDQHVAHERVLFERVMEKLTSGTLESQRMLVPMTIDLAPGEREALLARAAELVRFGFEIEDFGGDTVKITALPAILSRDDSDSAVRALAQDLEGLDRGLRVEEALKRIAALTACHAAVKANYPLTMEKMGHILEELRATAYSTVCPHGRPVMLRLTRREVEKNFERI
jgi:DNA mismatch repair protein MutL